MWQWKSTLREMQNDPFPLVLHTITYTSLYIITILPSLYCRTKSGQYATHCNTLTFWIMSLTAKSFPDSWPTNSNSCSIVCVAVFLLQGNEKYCLTIWNLAWCRQDNFISLRTFLQLPQNKKNNCFWQTKTFNKAHKGKGKEPYLTSVTCNSSVDW